jgi:hypothetical protein
MLGKSILGGAPLECGSRSSRLLRSVHTTKARGPTPKGGSRGYRTLMGLSQVKSDVASLILTILQGSILWFHQAFPLVAARAIWPHAALTPF